jgi:hypothetical protein
MQVLINTKSNYRNLNGQWVNIKQFIGTIIACEIYCEKERRLITFDISISEAKSIKQLTINN